MKLDEILTMEESGLPKPEFKQSGFILKAIVKNTDFGGE